MAIRRRKPKGPKKVPYRLIEPESGAGRALYPLMNRLITEFHDDLREARIALAWHAGWKRNVDGQQKLGQCKKASELDRELKPFDFVIVLNRAFFEDALVTEAQRAALIDHELCHACLKYEDNGEPAVDERGRKCYQLRRHDLEEFVCIAERHGMWKRDLEAFGCAITRNKYQGNLFDPEPKAEAAAPANGNGNGHGKAEIRLVSEAEFTKALKKECLAKGWTYTRRADGQVEIRVPAVQ